MKILKGYVDSLIGFAFLFWWFAGIVYAVGWFKLLAVCFPPYSMYLVVEKILL